MTTQDVGKDPAAPTVDDAESPRRLWVPTDGGVSEVEESAISHGFSRRTALRVGAVGAAGVALTAGRSLVEPYLAQTGTLSSDGVFAAAATALADLIYIEAFPTSPLILEPFKDELPIPKALAPVSQSEYSGWANPAGPGQGSRTRCATSGTRSGPAGSGTPTRSSTRSICWSIRTPSPLRRYCRSTRTEGQRSRSTRRASPCPRAPSDRCRSAQHDLRLQRHLPRTADQRRIRQARPRPLRESPRREPAEPGPAGFRCPGLVIPDAPAQRAHRAGKRRQPPLHHALRTEGNGLRPADVLRQPVFELARRWGRPGESRPSSGSTTTGWTTPDRTSTRAWSASTPSTTRRTGWTWATSGRGCGPPGVRTDNSDGSFDVDHDIPMAFFDCRLDDGVTTHQDIHDLQGEFPDVKNPNTHPEWWGKTFYKHFASHGFVGDIFTVNGTAYPTLEVKRRNYRVRFLDASLARIYEFKLMSFHPGPEDVGLAGLHGRRTRRPVPHSGQPAVHEVHPDRRGRRIVAVPDHPRLLRTVAGQAT